MLPVHYSLCSTSGFQQCMQVCVRHEVFPTKFIYLADICHLFRGLPRLTHAMLAPLSYVRRKQITYCSASAPEMARRSLGGYPGPRSRSRVAKSSTSVRHLRAVQHPCMPQSNGAHSDTQLASTQMLDRPVQ